MDVRYINPFVEGVESVFTTMLNLRPKRNAVKISNGGGTGYALTSLVGISGQLSGVVVLRFPSDTAVKLAAAMGLSVNQLDAQVVDAISELVNMVGGFAKAKFDYDPPLQLGLPTVVEGTDYKVKYPTKSVWLEIPFECGAGQFTMEITFGSN